jgi:hypothetical protein
MDVIEKVKADVLLGVDGMAHAPRFVQEKRVNNPGGCLKGT